MKQAQTEQQTATEREEAHRRINQYVANTMTILQSRIIFAP
jgi:F0F1-type ATP synthase membrane subunit b/b'